MIASVKLGTQDGHWRWGSLLATLLPAGAVSPSLASVTMHSLRNASIRPISKTGMITRGRIRLTKAEAATPKVGYVLEGEIELKVDGRRYRAKKGDSSTFARDCLMGIATWASRRRA